MSSQLSDTTFDGELASSPTPVVVEFFAPWCGNCRRIAGSLDSLAAEFAPTVRFAQVNADENPELVTRFGVRSTPTLFVLHAGQQVGSVVGAQPEPVLRELFALAADPDAPDAGAAASWVPAEACTLPTADQPARLAEFEALFATSLRGVERPETRHLRLHLADAATVFEQARDLTARESVCCAFFDFHLTHTATEVVIDVRVPAERVAVLDGLEQQAHLARTC